MGTRKKVMIDTLLDLVDKGGVNEFFCRKMVLFVSFLWSSIIASLLYLFGFINRYFFRFHVDRDSPKGNSGCPILSQHDSPVVSNSFESEPEPEVIELEDSEYGGFGDKETPKFSFKFQFQTYYDAGSSNGGSSVTVDHNESVASVSTSKYQFLPSKDFSSFMEEPEVVSFTLKELYMNSNEDSLDNKEILDEGFLSKKDFLQHNSDKIAVDEDVMNGSSSVEETRKLEPLVVDEFLLLEKDDSITSDRNSSDREGNSTDREGNSTDREGNSLDREGTSPDRKGNSPDRGENSPDREDFSNEIQLLSEKEFLGFDSDIESVSFGDRFSAMNNMMDSGSERFFSDGDYDNEVESDNITNFDGEKRDSVESFPSCEKIHLENQGILDPIDADISDQSSLVENVIGRYEKEIDLVGDIPDPEIPHFEKLSDPETKAQIEREYCQIEAECAREDFGGEVAEDDLVGTIRDSEIPHFEKLSDPETEAQIEREYCEMEAECVRENFGGECSEGKHEEPNVENSSYWDPEDSNGLEALWEHQNLIEQLKMELKKVKATGLPTIFEESESPRMSEDLKPWKMDEKFLHEDRMDELHKFYKSYRDRMRKLDILNYQKMYAMGFLQLKDPLQSIASKKSSTPTLTSVLSQSFRLSRRQKPEDSTVKFVKELQSDLEVVYVGQVCLSWEFLHWQYGKARELLQSDPYETRQYNQVAGEFQQFQVLTQRFLEDELFQGPRVQNYIKNRCILRSLLQVPVIKEDSRDKDGIRRRKDAITCSMLMEIIEESMRTFWEFVRTDKDEANAVLKGLLKPQVELLDPADSDLLVEVQTNLQKKEKKLKDILRSGNCIVRRFQKHHEEEGPDQLLFFSQIDMKLVARVLKMSRITSDQLVWCHKKLKKINIVHRKVQVEPSFLLFP